MALIPVLTEQQVKNLRLSLAKATSVNLVPQTVTVERRLPTYDEPPTDKPYTGNFAITLNGGTLFINGGYV